LRRIKWFSDLFEELLSQVVSKFLVVEGSLTGESISRGLAGGSKTPTRRFELASHACGDGSGVSWRESLRKSLNVALLENAWPVSEEGDIGDQLDWPLPAIVADGEELTQYARSKKAKGGKTLLDNSPSRPVL
jgi:hypothetical protein